MASDPLTLTLLTAKTQLNQSFSSLASLLQRDEVAVAGIFYGAVAASPADIEALATALQLDKEQLARDFATRYAVPGGFPSRGVGVEMPPKEPLIYRLYEIVMNYGWSYKAVLNEMFGDGIVSAIAFSTNIKKEVEEDGSEWAVITLRGKWLPYKRF